MKNRGFSRSDGSGFASKLIRRRFFSLLAVLSLILGVIGNMAVVRAADESAGGEVAVEAVTSEDTPVVESPLESNVVDPTQLEAAVDVPTTGVGDQVLQARDVGATLMQAMGTIGEGTGGSVTISGQKIWKDAEGVKLPDSVTFDLMRGGVKIGTATATAPNWTFSFNISDQPI